MSEMLARVAETIRLHTADAAWTPEGLAKEDMRTMLNPTFDMTLAGQQEVDLSEVAGQFEFISREEAADVWRAMMHTAALTHPVQSSSSPRPSGPEQQ